MALDYSYEIEQIIAEWKPRLDFNHWTVEIRWNELVHQATCIAEPQYLHMIISFNLNRLNIEILSRRDLEELVVHELVHARLWALANLFGGLDENGQRMVEFLEEEAVSQVTGALLRTKYNSD